jgi:cyclopropane-fatty-acyl-phospholipid synthase
MEFSRAQSELAAHGIFPYGSIELTRLEQHLARYFGREYARHKSGSDHPEAYGISSFLGEMTPPGCREASIQQHYDTEFTVFRAFLDKEYLAYTMAYYGSTAAEIEAATCSLEDAQKRKYQLVVGRAQVEDGQRVLDIGCGFGGLSKYLLQNFQNLHVTAVNPSAVQSAYIRARIKDPRNPLSSPTLNWEPAHMTA